MNYETNVFFKYAQYSKFFSNCLYIKLIYLFLNENFGVWVVFCKMCLMCLDNNLKKNSSLYYVFGFLLRAVWKLKYDDYKAGNTVRFLFLSD